MLFDQISEGPVYECLQLAALSLREGAQGSQAFRIDLSSEFIADLRHESLQFSPTSSCPARRPCRLFAQSRFAALE